MRSPRRPAQSSSPRAPRPDQLGRTGPARKRLAGLVVFRPRSIIARMTPVLRAGLRRGLRRPVGAPPAFATYRRSGPTGSTRRLIDALRTDDVRRSTVLDVGAAIGVIGLELLAAGADRRHQRRCRARARRRRHGTRSSGAALAIERRFTTATSLRSPTVRAGRHRDAPSGGVLLRRLGGARRRVRDPRAAAVRPRLSQRPMVDAARDRLRQSRAEAARQSFRGYVHPERADR